MTRSKGFTLIELLIVVAIIGILAAIAIPNFLQAQTRAKVSRSKADLRSITNAIESYCVDHEHYPPVCVMPGYEVPWQITTPIDYISSIPPDVFGDLSPDCMYYVFLSSNNYYYATAEYFDAHSWTWSTYPCGAGCYSNPSKWGLQAKGPDRVWARYITSELDRPYDFEYDPSNGTISIGNIIRSGP
jgi:prepilin-type N-terminal cleavage/methylation domain-containing protein